MNPDDRYASFLIRFQWMKNDQQPTWVVSMQSTKTGELRWYPNLEALITFLRKEFEDSAQQEVAECAVREAARPSVAEDVMGKSRQFTETQGGDKAGPNDPDTKDDHWATGKQVPYGREPAKEERSTK